jgi:lysyl-tRNA synthetase, class II
MLRAVSHTAGTTSPGQGEQEAPLGSQEHRRMLWIEQHPYGPRVYVLGQRVHEVALGLGIGALAAPFLAFDGVRVGREVAFAALGVGCWLVWKDWRDLVPRWRNTSTHSRLGLHRPSGRAYRSSAPALAAAAAVTLAVVEIVALTSPTTPPGELATRLAPAHMLALPIAGALTPLAAALRAGRRSAVGWTLALLAALALALAVGGHHIDTALVCLVIAWVLGTARGAFPAESVPVARASRAAAILSIVAGSSVLVWLLEGGHTDLLSGLAGSLCVAYFASAAWLALGRTRPLAHAPESRDAAQALVRDRGHDTLDAFKLRADARYLTSEDGEALLAYRVSSGVMLVAGDPVGPRASIPGLLARARAEAARHGLRVAVLNAGQRAAVAWRSAGLSAFYLGDEALLDCASFSLEGRAIRKVRQSVTRLTKLGYTVELGPVRELETASRTELSRLADTWRGDASERGFTMACTLDEPAAGDGLMAVARDGAGAARAILLLLPTYRRNACSLALMRRAPATPNGLIEFTVAETVAGLRSLGIEELSLNFAVLGRYLREGTGWRRKALRRVLRVGDRFFQLGSLYRFNDKFFPRWKPRYLMVESVACVPRTALAALVVEGFVPTLRLDGAGARLTQRLGDAVLSR